MPGFEPIEGPQVTPGRRGLLDQITTPDLGGVPWLAGLATIPEPCGVATPQALDYCSAVAGNLPELTGQASDEWAPFVVFGYDQCSAMGGVPTAEIVARARRNLLATESYQAEQQYGTNAAGISGYPSLAGGGAAVATLVTTAATAPGPALAALEGELSVCLHGQRGMIHATPRVVALWEAANMLHREGNLLLTVNDHIVVAGSGYPGNTPADAAPAAGSSYAYATEMVFGVRGEIQAFGDQPEQVDLVTQANTIRAYVYRPVILWQSECCRLAAQVNIALA